MRTPHRHPDPQRNLRSTDSKSTNGHKEAPAKSSRHKVRSSSSRHAKSAHCSTAPPPATQNKPDSTTPMSHKTRKIQTTIFAESAQCSTTPLPTDQSKSKSPSPVSPLSHKPQKVQTTIPHGYRSKSAPTPMTFTVNGIILSLSLPFKTSYASVHDLTDHAKGPKNISRPAAARRGSPRKQAPRLIL